MFSRLATVSTVLLLATFTAATAVARTDPHNPPPSDSCTTGSIYCCNSVADGSDPAVGVIAHLLGIVGTISGTVGLTCDPITVIGGGGNSCNSQTVCCTGNNYNGVLVVGCTPININV